MKLIFLIISSLAFGFGAASAAESDDADLLVKVYLCAERYGIFLVNQVVDLDVKLKVSDEMLMAAATRHKGWGNVISCGALHAHLTGTTSARETLEKCHSNDTQNAGVPEADLEKCFRERNPCWPLRQQGKKMREIAQCEKTHFRFIDPIKP